MPVYIVHSPCVKHCPKNPLQLSQVFLIRLVLLPSLINVLQNGNTDKRR